MRLDDLAQKLGIGRMSLHRYRQRPDWPGDAAGVDAQADWVKGHKGRRTRRKASAKATPPPGDTIEAGRSAEIAEPPGAVAIDDLPAAPGPGECEKIRGALQAAREGRLPWLDSLTRKAGYGELMAGTLILSAGELCALIGLNRTTLSSWELKGLPEAGQGQGRKTYDLARVLQWIMAYHKEQVAAVREVATRGLAEARRENITADSKLKQQKLDERAKLLLPAAAVWALYAKTVSTFTNSFRPKPGEYGVALEGKSPDAIRRHVDQDLNRTFLQLRETVVADEFIPADAQPLFDALIRAIFKERDPDYLAPGEPEAEAASAEPEAGGNGGKDREGPE